MEENVERMKETITNLKKKFSIPDETLSNLQSTAKYQNKILTEVWKNQVLQNRTWKSIWNLSSFAVTLHLVSAQAYR